MDLFSAAIFVGAAFSLFYKLASLIPRESHAKKIIRGVPRSHIHDAPDNKVTKVIGEVVALSEPLLAPLTGRGCVCYELTIEESIKEEREERWVMLAQDTHRQNFLLREGNDVALVRVRYANMYLFESLSSSSTMKSAPLRVQAFLEKHGELTTGRSRTIRYRERLLEPGKQASACGYATREIDLQAESSGYRDTGTRLTFEHQEDHDLYISNDPATFL
jgi:hypothetical protein